MKQPWMTIRKQWFLPTKEDWRDNYPDDTVLVRIVEGWHPQFPMAYNLHLVLWGTKNFGMHRWVKADILNVDRKRRQLIVEVNEFPLPLTMGWLEENELKFIRER